MKETEEIELVRSMRTHDHLAHKKLYEHYVGRLTAICQRYVVDQEDVKDVLQESFLHVFTCFSSFSYRGAGSLEAWITRIVINESLKHLREKGRLENMLITKDDLQKDDCCDDAFDQLETFPQDILHQLIQKLPDGYRTVLNLYVFEEKSHKEIGKLLHINERTSSSQLHKAKVLLGRWIKEYKKNHAYE